MIIAEIPSGIWNFPTYMDKPIGRSRILVSQYLAMNEIVWVYGDTKNADFRVYKEENVRNGLLSFRRLKSEYQKRFEKCAYININGEAQENSRCAYALADPERTYAAAPGDRFKRVYYPTVWDDPQLDTWDDRLDRICWIGRPLPDRLRLAQKLRNLKIPFDVYGKERWNIPEYQGAVLDERAVSRSYKYRIVMENSFRDKYHTEKLINSLMSGCVTFYVADPMLKTPLDGAYYLLNDTTLRNREVISKTCLDRMKEVLYGDVWEAYSFKAFFDIIIEEAYRSTNLK